MILALTLQLADGWGMHGDVGGGWMIGMMFLMVLFWAAVIFGIVWLVRGAPRGDWRKERRETPIEILDRRFAEGAISAEDYNERRKVIANTSG
jgi:putative membrane protein